MNHHQQPPRLRRRHAPVRHRDPHHPRVRRPRRLVFKAYTTPELVKRWWGFETSEWLVCEIDLRVGRHVALRHPRDAATRGRLPRRVPGDRRARAGSSSTEVYEGFARAPTTTGASTR